MPVLSEVIMTDVAQEIFSHISDQVKYPSVHSEEEWSALLSTKDVGDSSGENLVVKSQSSSKKEDQTIQRGYYNDKENEEE